MLEHLERQKKLTVNQWKIFAAATIGDMLDFFDFLLIAFVLAFIVKDWGLTYGQSGAILLASGVSAPLGSPRRVSRMSSTCRATRRRSVATCASFRRPTTCGRSRPSRCSRRRATSRRSWRSSAVAARTDLDARKGRP